MANEARMQFMAPSPIIDAALSILADGKPRTADEILAEGRARGLYDADMTRKHVYTSLSQYIERAVGAGRKPELTEDIQHRFRINRTPDDWPSIDETGLPALTATPALSPDTRLRSRARNKRRPAPIQRNTSWPFAASSLSSDLPLRTWAASLRPMGTLTHCSVRFHIA